MHTKYFGGKKRKKYGLELLNWVTVFKMLFVALNHQIMVVDCMFMTLLICCHNKKFQPIKWKMCVPNLY